MIQILVLETKNIGKLEKDSHELRTSLEKEDC